MTAGRCRAGGGDFPAPSLKRNFSLHAPPAQKAQLMAVTQTINTFLTLITRGKPHECFTTALSRRFRLGRGPSGANPKHFTLSLCHPPLWEAPRLQERKTHSGDSTTFPPLLFPHAAINPSAGSGCCSGSIWSLISAGMQSQCHNSRCPHVPCRPPHTTPPKPGRRTSARFLL